MRLATLALVAALVACAPAATASPSAVTSATVMPSAPGTNTVASPTPRDPGLVPALQPDAIFANMRITVDGDEPPGQPWEGTVLAVTRPTVDPAYRAHVASAFDMSGDGILGAAPDRTAPWRLWTGPSGMLVLNEITGDVLFFGPNTDTATLPSGDPRPSTPPYALLAMLGSTADFNGPGVRSFDGGDTTAGVEQVVDGSWLEPGARSTFAIFPQYHSPSGAAGTIIYSRDELFLYSSGGALAEVVHRPLIGVTVAAVRDVNTTLVLRDAIKLLKKDPAHYLRLLSITPTNEPLTLVLDVNATGTGHAWAGGTSGDLTHLNDTLVPVWAFVAHGTTASGKPVSALFTVDGIAPPYLRPPASSSRNLTADLLLHEQLTQLGGHRVGLLSPEGVLMDELSANACPGTYTLSRNDADSAIATVTCPNGARLVMTLRRAFPGYEHSIWYVSDTRK